MAKRTKMVRHNVFCFTGKCPLPRSEMEAIAIAAGAYTCRSVTKRTSILVVADLSRFNHTSSKIIKAHEYNVEMIDPEEFFEMCNKPILTQSIEKKSIKTRPSTIDKPTKSATKKKKYSTSRRIEL